MSSTKISIPKILCCIPTYHAVEPAPLISLLILSQQTGRDEMAQRYGVRWAVPGPKIPIMTARNWACEVVVKNQLSHLLFLDDDMVPPSDSIRRLLLHDVDIVVPLFFRSSSPHEPLIFRENHDGGYSPLMDFPKDSLFQVDAAGTGMMLIKREVLESIPKPRFYKPLTDHGMDLTFCTRARKEGFKVWCDSSMEVKQLGETPLIGYDDFMASRPKP